MTKSTSKELKLRLQFTPYAWAKLTYLRDKGSTEVGGWGILHPEKPLTVIDIRMPKQECTAAWCEFDDLSSANLLADMVFNEGFTAEQCQRVWIHTHPGNSPTPSHQDEQTWDNQMSSSEWAVMFILARGGSCYARIQYGTPFGRIENEMTVGIDYSLPFEGTDHAAWDALYDECVTTKTYVFQSNTGKANDAWYNDYYGTTPSRLTYKALPTTPEYVTKEVYDKAIHELKTSDLFLAWPDQVTGYCLAENIDPTALYNYQRRANNWQVSAHNKKPSPEEVDMILWANNLEWDCAYKDLLDAETRLVYGWYTADVMSVIVDTRKRALAGEQFPQIEGLNEWLKTFKTKA